jgi:hypothetical protein
MMFLIDRSCCDCLGCNIDRGWYAVLVFIGIERIMDEGNRNL